MENWSTHNNTNLLLAWFMEWAWHSWLPTIWRKKEKLKMELVSVRKPFLTSLISPCIAKPGDQVDYLSVPCPLYICWSSWNYRAFAFELQLPYTTPVFPFPHPKIVFKATLKAILSGMFSAEVPACLLQWWGKSPFFEMITNPHGVAGTQKTITCSFCLLTHQG